jgi:hypothetical protein
MISEDANFSTIDLTDFYLGTDLPHSEYIQSPIRLIPANVIEFYNLVPLLPSTLFSAQNPLWLASGGGFEPAKVVPPFTKAWLQPPTELPFCFSQHRRNDSLYSCGGRFCSGVVKPETDGPFPLHPNCSLS